MNLLNMEQTKITDKEARNIENQYNRMNFRNYQSFCISQNNFQYMTILGPDAIYHADCTVNKFHIDPNTFAEAAKDLQLTFKHTTKTLEANLTKEQLFDNLRN